MISDKVKEIDIEILFRDLNLKEKKPVNKKRGSGCSKSGNNYEKLVWNTIKNLQYNNKPFNTQDEKDLAGSGNNNDIQCDFNNSKIGIECKSILTAPDYQQCTLKYKNNIWRHEFSKHSKISKENAKIIHDIIGNNKLFGDTPPCIKKNITQKEWNTIKNKTNRWNDIYIPINDSTTIRNLYKLKGNGYIQIGDYGLYHLGKDIYNFDVPEFLIKQQLRVRIKSHGKRKDGSYKYSVTAACQPCPGNKLMKSPYSLDNIKKIPKNLKTQNN